MARPYTQNTVSKTVTLTVPAAELCAACVCGVEECAVQVLDVRTGDSFCGQCNMQLHLWLRLTFRVCLSDGGCADCACNRMVTLEVPRGSFAQCGLLCTNDITCDVENFGFQPDCGIICVQVRITIMGSESGCCVEMFANAGNCACGCRNDHIGTCTRDACMWNNSTWYLTDGTRYTDRIGKTGETFCTCGRGGGWR